MLPRCQHSYSKEGSQRGGFDDARLRQLDSNQHDCIPNAGAAANTVIARVSSFVTQAIPAVASGCPVVPHDIQRPDFIS